MGRRIYKDKLVSCYFFQPSDGFDPMAKRTEFVIYWFGGSCKEMQANRNVPNLPSIFDLYLNFLKNTFEKGIKNLLCCSQSNCFYNGSDFNITLIFNVKSGFKSTKRNIYLAVYSTSSAYKCFFNR